MLEGSPYECEPTKKQFRDYYTHLRDVLDNHEVYRRENLLSVLCFGKESEW